MRCIGPAAPIITGRLTLRHKWDWGSGVYRGQTFLRMGHLLTVFFVCRGRIYSKRILALIFSVFSFLSGCGAVGCIHGTTVRANPIARSLLHLCAVVFPLPHVSSSCIDALPAAVFLSCVSECICAPYRSVCFLVCFSFPLHSVLGGGGTVNGLLFYPSVSFTCYSYLCTLISLWVFFFLVFPSPSVHLLVSVSSCRLCKNGWMNEQILLIHE